MKKVTTMAEKQSTRVSKISVSKASSVLGGQLQRCDCGKSGGECESCRKKRVAGESMMQRAAVNTSAEDVTRILTKSRFEQDFSSVPAQTKIRTANRGDGGVSDAGMSPSVAQPAQRPTVSRDKRACVTSEQLPTEHRGMSLVPAEIEGLYHLHDFFRMNVSWNNNAPDCDCRCGEYRQYVKGHIRINGRDQVKRLANGAVLEERVYHEDGDPNPYGYRSSTGSGNDQFLPDRVSGCSYRGFDTPGIADIRTGTVLDVALTFKGQTYDVCRNTFGEIHEWSSAYHGTAL
jgi:hypothetical protein